MTEKTDFATEYRFMTDEQLLEVAAEGNLVDEAKSALQVEMRNRKLTSEMVQSYHAENEHYELARKAEDPNTTAFFTLFGRAYLSDEDKAQNIQVRTKWLTLRGLPIIPIASYRYSCRQETTGLIDWKEEKVINQVPLNWKQAGKTWLKSMGLFILGVLLFFAAFTLYDRLRHS